MKVLRLSDMQLIEWEDRRRPTPEILEGTGLAEVFFDSDKPTLKEYQTLSEDIYFDETNNQYRVRYIINNDIEKAKQLKLQEIQDAFINEMSNGYIDFTIPSSNTQVQVDARRNAYANDLQNVEGLIEIMQLQNIQEVQYKCYDNEDYTMTLNDLIALKYALMARGLQLYQKKHYLEELVEQAETVEEVNNVRW